MSDLALETAINTINIFEKIDSLVVNFGWHEIVEFPIIFIDVGYDPHNYSLTEIAYTVVTGEEKTFKEQFKINFLSFNNSNYFKKHKALFINALSCCKTIVAHNLKQDIDVLLKAFIFESTKCFEFHSLLCTARLGTQYTKSYVYRKGIKIKKYPKLTSLYRYLFKVKIYKGNIFNDIEMLVLCFHEMYLYKPKNSLDEELENLLNALSDIEITNETFGSKPKPRNRKEKTFIKHEAHVESMLDNIIESFEG